MSVGSDPQHEALKSRLQQDPDSLLFARIADSMLKHGQVDEAIRICEEGIRKHPYYVTGHMVLGKCYLKKKLFDLAEKEFKRVILFDPKYIAAHKYYGDLMREVGWDNTCEMSYRKILSIDPLDRNAREMLEALQRNKPNDQEVVTPGHGGFIEDKIIGQGTREEGSAEEIRTKTVPINLDDDLFADVSDTDEETDPQQQAARPAKTADVDEENDEEVITTILEDIFDDEDENDTGSTKPASAKSQPDELDIPIARRNATRDEDAFDEAFSVEADRADEDDEDVFGLNIGKRETPLAEQLEEQSSTRDKIDEEDSASQKDDPFAGMFDQFDEETIEFDELTELGQQAKAESGSDAGFNIDFTSEEEPASEGEEEENYFDSLENDMSDEDDLFEQLGAENDAVPAEQSASFEVEDEPGYAPDSPPKAKPEPASQNGERSHFEESVGFEREKIVTPTLGEIYAAQGQYAKAINVFELLLKKEPGNSNYQQKVSFLKKKMEESENA